MQYDDHHRLDLASPIELELGSKGLQQVVGTKEIVIGDCYMD